MHDTCVITQPTSPGTWDEATGAYGPSTPTTVYAGPCRVRQPDQAEREAVTGEADWTLTGVIVSVPVSAGVVPIGSTVTVTACAMDPAMTDSVYRVVGPHGQTHATARRLRCVAVARG